MINSFVNSFFKALLKNVVERSIARFEEQIKIVFNNIKFKSITKCFFFKFYKSRIYCIRLIAILTQVIYII